MFQGIFVTGWAEHFFAHYLNLAISLKGPPIPHPMSKTCKLTRKNDSEFKKTSFDNKMQSALNDALNGAELVIVLHIPTCISGERHD